MFTLIRVALRSFALGVVVGMLCAPRSGAETRRLIAERIDAWVDGLLEIAALPSVRQQRTRPNGYAEGATSRAARPASDAPAS